MCLNNKPGLQFFYVWYTENFAENFESGEEMKVSTRLLKNNVLENSFSQKLKQLRLPKIAARDVNSSVFPVDI